MPVVKSLDSFDFLAIPSLNKALVLELARCEFLDRKENLLLLGNSGTGKSHIALALGLAACQSGHRVRFTTAAALVSELIEARDEKHLLRFRKQLSAYELLIVDELGFVPLSKTGAELLFEFISQRYERASVLVTSNLPFDEGTEIFGSERLTGHCSTGSPTTCTSWRSTATATASSRAAANATHPPTAEPSPPERASGEKSPT